MIRKISMDRGAASDELGSEAGTFSSLGGLGGDPFQLDTAGIAQTLQAAPSTVASDIPGVNDAPTSTNLDGDAATYPIGTTDVRIDVGANVTIADVDSANFAGGTLRIQILDPVYAEDNLVRFIGTSRTLFNPGHVTSIGTVTVGEDADVVIALSTAATPATVQEFLRNLYYFNPNTYDPATEPRQVRITLTDGDGTANGGSDTLVINTTVTAYRVNSAPWTNDVLKTIDPDVAYTFRVEDFPFEDLDGDDLAGVIIATLPFEGEILLDGAVVGAGQFIAASDIQAGLLTFVPVGSDYGPSWADFQFQVRDDGGTANGGEDTNPYPSMFGFEIVDTPAASIQPSGFAPIEGQVRIGSAGAGQSEMAMAGLNFGNSYVVSWTQTNGPGEPSEVYAQVFWTDGMPLGGAYLVSTDAGHSAVAANDGGFVVAWESDGRVFVQQFSWNGTPSANAVQVATLTPGTEAHFTVTSLEYGGFVVAWHDNLAEGISAVFTQKFDHWGMPIGGPQQVSPFPGSDQFASVAALTGGDYIVTWMSLSQDGSGYNVVAQRVADWGAPYDPVMVNSTLEGDQQHPAVAVLADGGFIIVWQSNQDSATGEFGLYAQRYDEWGSAVGEEFRIDSVAAPAPGAAPSVTALPDGSFVVAWQSSSGSDIFTRSFDASDNPLGPETQVNTLTSGDQLQPTVATLSDGEIIIGWSSQNSSSEGVFTQLYSKGFEAIEQVALDLKGSLSLNPAELGADPIEVILSVGDGILDVHPGGSGVEVSGSGTNEVHMSGTAAQIDALFRSDPDSLVSFTAAGDAPVTPEALVLSVFRQGELVADANALIGVVPINDAPALSEPYTQIVEFIEGWGPIGLMEGVTLFDPDAVNLVGGSIELTGDGDASGGACIFLRDSGRFSVVDNGDGTFALTSWDYTGTIIIGTVEGIGTVQVRITGLQDSATQDLLNDLIDEFVYYDPSGTPSADRTVTLTVVDGGNGGRGGNLVAQVSQTLVTYVFNEAPGVTTSPGEASFVEGSGAPSEAVVVDDSLYLWDVDDDTLFGATVAIAEGYQAGEDELSFTNDNGALYGNIEGSFADGVLSLSSEGGTATLDQWQAALRAVWFTSNSEDPVAGTRLVTFTVNDGEWDSALATKLVTVEPRNDAPSGKDATRVVGEDGEHVFTLADFGFSDVEGHGLLAVAFDGPPTGGQLYRFVAQGAGGSWVPLDWNGTETVSAADLQAGRLSFRPDANVYGTGAASVAFRVVDDGPSTDGNQSVDPTPNYLQFDVAAVDDAAIARNDAVVTDEAGTVTGNLFADNGAGADSDVDGPALSIIAVNGSAANVGSQITLASGALLKVNAGGTFIYDPNGAFDALPTAATGAANATGTDSFTYALAGGGTATVQVLVAGLDSDDDIVGTSGSDILIGDGGHDRFFGQAGDDLYYVNDPADLVVEQANQGFDRIVASSDYALASGSHIELLSAGGASPVTLTGNALGQRLEGNAGANRLDGKGGADVLVGGAGADQFAFTTSPGVGNIDRILDFSTVDDRILLENAVFTGLGPGTLSSGAFRVGTSARDASDRIIYDPSTGALLFDADGNHGAPAVQFATLQPGLNLNPGDFLVI